MASSVGRSLAQAVAGRVSAGVRPMDGQEGRLLNIPTSDIEPDPNQPRKDLGELDGLTASIEAHGIQSPIVVSPTHASRFMVIAGHRRHAAATLLGLAIVPAIVRTVEDHVRLELQLIENVQRKDFNALEEARAYQRLMDEFGLSQGDVAKRVGKARKTINEALRALQLPEEMQAEYQGSADVQKSVSAALLVHIARLPKGEREAVWKQARDGKLTVAAARKQQSKKAAQPEASPRARDRRSASFPEQGLKVTLTVERLPDTDDPAAEISLDELVAVTRALLKGLK